MRIDVQPRGGGDRRGRIPKHAAAAKPHFDRGSVRPCGTSSQGPGWLALEPRSWATNYAIGDGDPAEPACGLGMDMECRHGSNGRWLGLHCPARLGCAGREHARRMRGQAAGRPAGLRRRRRAGSKRAARRRRAAWISCTRSGRPCLPAGSTRRPRTCTGPACGPWRIAAQGPGSRRQSLLRGPDAAAAAAAAVTPAGSRGCMGRQLAGRAARRSRPSLTTRLGRQLAGRAASGRPLRPAARPPRR